ncbi:MAG: DUF1284 domain-containing protein [Candidatus Hydrothermarchaeaceae archaeon]
MTSLRGHHLICLHFFRGEGYDAAFIENLVRVIDLTKSDGTTVQSGADDICASCPNLAGGECNYKGGNNERIEGLDATALGLLGLKAGENAEWGALKSMLPEIFSEWVAGACLKCDFLDTCRSTDLWKNLGQIS